MKRYYKKQQEQALLRKQQSLFNERASNNGMPGLNPISNVQPMGHFMGDFGMDLGMGMSMGNNPGLIPIPM